MAYWGNFLNILFVNFHSTCKIFLSSDCFSPSLFYSWLSGKGAETVCTFMLGNQMVIFYFTSLWFLND